YGVKIDRRWLDTVQAASVRLTSGCSASVVSGEGLVLTNDHCVIDCQQALSTAEKDFVKDGFVPAGRNEERTCPGMQAEILTSIVDVTEKINAATAGRIGGDFVRARDAAVAEI